MGFEGVQALDLVGPFEVFTGANVYLAAQGRSDDGYEVTIASLDGKPISTGTGLEIVAKPLPDPWQPIDTVVLPGGFGVDAARHDPDVIGLDPGGRQLVAARRQRVHRRLPCRGGRAARRLRRHHALGVRRPDGARVPFRRRRSRADLRAQLGVGVDGRGGDGGHRPVAVAGRGRLRHRRRADGGPLAGALPASPRRPDAVRRPGVDAARQTGTHPRRAGRHRLRTRWRT